MKNKGKKSLLALVLVALLLTAAVSGTLAYLADQSKPVTNTFTPTQVDIEVNADYTITNVKDAEGKNVDAYVRAVVLVNWKNGNDVFGEPVECTFRTEDGWIESGEFYYYTQKVPVGGITSKLVTDLNVTSSSPADGFTATVEILAQAIQAEPKDAVIDAWKVDPETLVGN